MTHLRESELSPNVIFGVLVASGLRLEIDRVRSGLGSQ